MSSATGVSGVSTKNLYNTNSGASPATFLPNNASLFSLGGNNPLDSFATTTPIFGTGSATNTDSSSSDGGIANVLMAVMIGFLIGQQNNSSSAASTATTASSSPASSPSFSLSGNDLASVASASILSKLTGNSGKASLSSLLALNSGTGTSTASDTSALSSLFDTSALNTGTSDFSNLFSTTLPNSDTSSTSSTAGISGSDFVLPSDTSSDILSVLDGIGTPTSTASVLSDLGTSAANTVVYNPTALQYTYNADGTVTSPYSDIYTAENPDGTTSDGVTQSNTDIFGDNNVNPYTTGDSSASGGGDDGSGDAEFS